MKSLLKISVFTLMVTLCSIPVYATTYISLHGVDTGTTGNISEMYYNVSTNFRVLIPPGATYFSLSMICDNQAVVTTVARFGQAPSGYYPLPAYSSPSAKTLDQARTANIISGNSDGLLNVALQYFYPQPLAESQAGWFYVDIVGSGVRHVDYNLSVNASVYTEWYNRKKGSIDCLCTQIGQCAMCDSNTQCTSSVTANFSASQTSITAGSSVSFTNTSSGSATYLWTFGDGTSYSGSSPPAHSYSNVGTYTVTLTATPTDTNCSVSTKTQAITVSQQSCTSPVTANFSVNSEIISSGSSVSFNNSSSGSASNYSWVFGDGTSYSGFSPPAHTYTNSGTAAVTYTVILTVTPANSGCSVATKTQAIIVNPASACSNPVTAGFQIVNTQELKEGVYILFRNTSTKNGSLASVSDATWSWKVSDPNGQIVSTGNTMDFSFTPSMLGKAIIYTIELTASPSGCASSKTQQNVSVTSLCTTPGVIASFTANPMTIIPGQPVTFTNTSTGTGTKWLWEFGDGSQSSSISPLTHTYAQGTYTVKLTAWDSNNCQSAQTPAITINANTQSTVTARFEVPSNLAAGNSDVTFINKSEPTSASWSWIAKKDSSQIATATTKDFSIKLSAAGTYTIALKATSGQTSSQSQVDVSVKDSPLTICDANADQHIGLEEVIYMLQIIAGIRP